MGCLPKTELKCAVHCPELVPPPPHQVSRPRLAEKAVWNTYYTPGRQEAEHLEGLAGRVTGAGLGAGLAEGPGAAAGVPSAGLPPFLGGPAAVPGEPGERESPSSEGECGRGVAVGPAGSEGCRRCLGVLVQTTHASIHPSSASTRPPAHSFIHSFAPSLICSFDKCTWLFRVLGTQLGRQKTSWPDLL